MEERSAQKSIDELLVDLNNPDPTRRVDVLNSLAGSGIKDQRILNELRLTAKGDPDPSVRDAARKAMRSLGMNNPADKKKDFWRGVGLFFGLNILMGLCSWGLNYAIFAVIPFIVTWDVSNLFAFYSQFSWVIGFFALAINIGLLIYFGATRSQIALGMLAAFGVAFVITICLGVIFTAWCLYALRSGGF